jgi:microcin C transport system substrate-binding protein
VFSHIGSSGRFNQNFLTFNSLNSFILKGDGAQGMELTFASLMARATDEPDALYGLAARAVQVSEDSLAYRFLLRPGIKFHDGTPLTAHDIAFSLRTLKDKGHPVARILLRDFTVAEVLDDTTVVVRFAVSKARDAPLLAATLPIFSRAYYADRAFDESTLDVPLESGPYKVGRFEVGRFIEYERVADWWGADLPVMRGQNNFDVVRYEFYRDRDLAFEAFTAKNYLFREEFTSRVWASRYDFPAPARLRSACRSPSSPNSGTVNGSSGRPRTSGHAGGPRRKIGSQQRTPGRVEKPSCCTVISKSKSSRRARNWTGSTTRTVASMPSVARFLMNGM